MKQKTYEQLEMQNLATKKNQELATFIRRKRLELGLHQKHIAIKTGLAMSYVSEVEGGVRKNPTYSTVVSILQCLGYEIEIKKIKPKELY